MGIRSSGSVLIQCPGGVGTQLPSVLSILFDTYPLYVDTRSRQAVEQCLSSIASSTHNKKVTSAFAALVQQEAAKASIAPGSAFVLVRWSSQLMQDSASDKALWDAFGRDLVTALTNALNILLASSPKDSTRATAVRVSRRAFRAVFGAPSETRRSTNVWTSFLQRPPLLRQRMRWRLESSLE